MNDNRYNHKEAEKQAQQLWKKHKIYEHIDHKKVLFTVDTPPPTVSGSLHVGHVFSYTHTDIIVRYKRLQNFAVFYPFGLDDNGLPTERFVEQKHNIQSSALKRSEFIEYCLKESALMGEKFCAVLEQLGLSADFGAAYSTISAATQAQSQKSFIELYKKGHIYRKADPALYCTTCQTTVAQAELDDAEKSSVFYTITFKTGAGKELSIATTRPELLPSCVAIVCHPNDSRYKGLIGTKVYVPIYGHEVTVMSDERVEQDKGTGLVMICTFGDKTDIVWFRALSLPYRPSIGADGRFLGHTGPLAGLTVFSARKKIVELLEQEKRITDQKEIMHAVSLHERCKKEIEFLILPQWFVAILPHKEKLATIADKITWYPEFMKSRYLDWVKNLSWDWCISRQRKYGIPFPVFHCLSCNKVILPPENVKLPVDPQEQKFVSACLHCKSSTIIPDTDVMDTWNTSSITPYLCKTLFEEKYKQEPKFLPMSMRPQAHDIIRTWAFDTIVKTVFHENIIPWHHIVISGHVLSKEKRKLSKKEGAALVPELLLEQYPADAIRYWTASSRLGYDIVYSEDELKNGSRLITKLYNAFRLIQPHIKDVVIDKHKKPADLINRWILNEISKVFDEYTTYFGTYEFGLALQRVEQFFWQDLCDYYLEFIKHRLYNPAEYPDSLIQETKNTLMLLGIRVLQLFAPFVPHITEHIFQELYLQNQSIISLHQTYFAEYQIMLHDKESELPMSYLISVIKEARKLKTEHHVSLKTEIEMLTMHPKTKEMIAVFKEYDQFLKKFLHVNAITLEKPLGKESSSMVKAGEKWQMSISL